MKRFSLLLFFMSLVLFSVAQTASRPPKYEVRAVWLTTIGGLDWPHSYAQSGRSAEKQRQELRQILDQLQRAGINTVLLQTRIRATTIYPSQYEPWDGCLSGKPGVSPGYDALAFAIEECHKRGMELHAWVVAIPVGKWSGAGCKRLRQRQPKLLRKIGDEGYMNPENPKTGSYLADMCGEIVKNYDVDGIHLDYIRYPETWNRKINRPRGRNFITSIVRAVHHRVKTLKPWVKMSCSPIGKSSDLSRYWSHGWNAYETVCQDAQGWLREGLMDQLYPMMYFRGNNFYPFAVDWAEQSYGRTIAPGLGIYFMSPREKNWPLRDITQEMEVLRQQGLGHTYFRSKFFTDNVKGIYDFASCFDATPALIPPMTWESSRRPDAPAALQRDDASQSLTWSAVHSAFRNQASTLLYNVYSSRTYPVDITDARNLVAMRLQRNSIVTDGDRHRYYAVTTLDRYGNESEALQERVATGESEWRRAETFLDCDGKELRLPKKPSTLDAKLLVVETLQGGLIATLPYRQGTVSVTSLPDGMYVLRSLNRKGVTHRLGTFIIRRK